jgi:acyl-CoA synthetase (NDP forming)
MDLSKLITPASIAVIGASEDTSRLGGKVLANLKGDFKGALYPVNPRRDLVQGIPSYRSVEMVEDPPDLAVVVTPASDMLTMVKQCAERGVGAMVVITSGFGETGPEGQAIQDEMSVIARQADMALLGPNSLGLVNLSIGMQATFVTLPDPTSGEGNIAVVSQSGAVGMMLFERIQQSGLSPIQLCTLGNEAGVTCSQLIGHMVEVSEIRVVVAFLEGLKDPHTLVDAGLRAIELGKPIIAIKAGGSGAGSRAAVSHTGSLSVPDRVVDAIFDRAGIIRVDSFDRMIEATKGFALAPPPRGRRIIVLTGSGGAGVMMADSAEASGLELPEPSPALRDELSRLVPQYGSLRNPIDYTASLGHDIEKLKLLIQTVTGGDEYDTICMSGIARGRPWHLDMLAEAGTRRDRQLFAFTQYPEIVEELCRRGVPAFNDPIALIRTIALMADYAEQRSWLLAHDDPWHGNAVHTERVGDIRALPAHEARVLLEDAGVPFAREQLVTNKEEAVAFQALSRGPIALKLSAEWLPHKSDVGGVILNLSGPEDVSQAYKQLVDLSERLAPDGVTAAPPVLAQQMVPKGLELVCGGFRDPTFGPVVTVGIGGTLVEIIAEQELALAPVGRDHAQRMIRRLANGRIVDVKRGLDASEIDTLSGVIMALGTLMASNPDITEIDINPVIVSDSGVVGVDALVVIAETPITVPSSEAQ